MKKPFILLLALVLAAPLSAAGVKKAPKQKTAVWEWMQANSAPAIACSGDIWGHPELGEHETYSSERLARYLEENGFTIERGVAGIPTAWVAAFTNGTGGPSIGYLAEFDALPGLSQEAFCPVRKPLVKGGPGHGCGHSLLGVASSFAAVGVKKAMIDNNIQGTLRVYGCPAEETLVGKIYMARAGVFNASRRCWAGIPPARTRYPTPALWPCPRSSSSFSAVRPTPRATRSTDAARWMRSS